MNLKGSKTEQNLWSAFEGESKVRMKYTYYASQADKEGYKQMAAIFQETADNEKEHAKRFFKFLIGGSIRPTEENLLEAAEGELHEHSKLYPEYERIAREEGFHEIADVFREIAEVEEEHEKRFRKLLANIKNQTVFKKTEPVKWKCRNCGYVHEGTEAPEVCPACDHPQSYYEVLCENY
ncbi:MAG: rubrerythrin [Syntrophomonadaceae bacterium]|jgi:rubrerythrin|nr:rubrerythrin family protein [Bacillota bacterium]NLM88086.1 rubrerythrin family protein [Syntrophomonadaceae bacterium]HAA09280.1 rubrerythrin family protein [Syntrophomonas sp.]HQA50247.1 rubrerythrin family protein [Syntrophomonadaceae bacterium]HQD90600.1 rubrerythrin family protein [Syntrophomonadaceae bacterium]